MSTECCVSTQVYQRTRYSNVDNTSSNEKLQQMLESLSINTLRELQPIIAWMEEHQEKYDMFGSILKQVSNHKLNNYEAKEEEPSDQIYDPQHLSVTLQKYTEKTIKKTQKEKNFAQFFSKLHKNNGLNKKAKPFIPNSQRLVVINEGKEMSVRTHSFQKENYTIIRAHIFLLLVEKIICELNEKKGKTKLNTISVVQFMKNNKILPTYFNNKANKKQFCEALKTKCNVKTQRAQALWDHINNTYAQFQHSNQEMKFDACEIKEISEEKSMVYISEHITQNTIKSLQCINKYFKSAVELFHHLKWSIKMQQNDSFYKIFKNSVGFEIILFDVELRDHNGNRLYILGIKNDKTVKKPKNISWKMMQFMTAKELEIQFNINHRDLPKPSRKYGQMCKQQMDIPKQSTNYTISKSIYIKLSKIKTHQKQSQHKRKPNVLQMNGMQFNECITKAIHSTDTKHKCIPIITFGKHKKKYFFDLMLPVQLPNNNWIGLIFRNHEPISICIDCNDIKTKAKLYDFVFDKNKYQWLTNNVTKLQIIYKEIMKPALNLPKYSGIVSAYFSEKYGFIKCATFGKDLFFLETDFESNGIFMDITAGLKVRFNITTHLYKQQQEIKAINVCCV